MPPASYMWLWLGNFKRWHKRYFVASEAPGVLLIYKRANMKGKVRWRAGRPRTERGERRCRCHRQAAPGACAGPAPSPRDLRSLSDWGEQCDTRDRLPLPPAHPSQVWSTSLVDATVAQDDSHPRQIRLATPSGTIFLRVLRPEERQPWLACLRDSVATYRKHKEVVDTLAAAAGAAGEADGGVGTGERGKGRRGRSTWVCSTGMSRLSGLSAGK